MADMTAKPGDWLEVPEAPRPRNIVPEVGPDEFGGFRFPAVFDGLDASGQPTVDPERDRIDDAAERDRVLAYLAAGAVVLDSRGRGTDLLAPSRRYAVPAGFHTDGAWIWPDAVEYYLRWHHIAPAPAFYQHIVANQYAMPAVAPHVVAAAASTTLARADVVRRRQRDWMDAHGLLQRGDETRFPPELNRRLVDIGWHAGRDVHEQVDAWLARAWRPQPPSTHPDDAGRHGYEPNPAALRVLYEFGGVVNTSSGPGISAAQTPFEIYPVTGDEDLDLWRPRIRLLARYLNLKLFQVGEVERGLGALAVAGDGSVYLVGPANLFAGENIDEALHRLLDGVQCEPA